VKLCCSLDPFNPSFIVFRHTLVNFIVPLAFTTPHLKATTKHNSIASKPLRLKETSTRLLLQTIHSLEEVFIQLERQTTDKVQFEAMSCGGKMVGMIGVGTLLALSTIASTSAEITDVGGLRRKRLADSNQMAPRRQLSKSTMDEELASRFFLPASSNRQSSRSDKNDVKTSKKEDPLDIDMRTLMEQMNFDMSMSIMTPQPTPFPTLKPTEQSNAPSFSTAPTVTDCENPGTCENRLRDQIFQVSVRVGTVDALDDPASPQSLASEWILEECDNDPPIDPCTETQIILNEQRYALAVMYFSLGGDNWNYGAIGSGEGEWMSPLNYCEWGPTIQTQGGGSYEMLECDEFGNVLNLNMQSNNMEGTIPPEIGVLVYMTSYISFFNAQTGPIPTSLGLILPLQTFDVESNNMDGDLFKPEFYGLQEIINFRASLNNFRGTIPTEIGQWTKLQNLWFAQNFITGTLPTEIGNCVDMGAFLFYENEIQGTLPTELGNMNALTWIDMEDNQIVGTIPEEFYSNLDLEEVIFKNNTLAGTISDSVGNLPRLATFWASFNEFSGTIPTTFGNLANLEELELQNNRLEGAIPIEFGSMESIEFLSMESNELTGTIPSELFSPSLGALRILYLNDNRLTGVIPNNYGQLPRIKDLWLSDNLLTGTLPIIAEGEFLFLEELLLNNNDLTGSVDESLCLIRNNTVPGGQLGVFHADCQPSADGGAPQIQCSCCTACFE